MTACNTMWRSASVRSLGTAIRRQTCGSTSSSVIRSSLTSDAEDMFGVTAEAYQGAVSARTVCSDSDVPVRTGGSNGPPDPRLRYGTRDEEHRPLSGRGG